jgi:hypothetical protein
VAVGRIGVQVQPDLGQLQADLGVHAARADQLEHAVVVIGHLSSLAEVGQVLAEMGQQDADAERAEDLRGIQGLLDRLARHEAAHRAPGERQVRQVPAQPGIASHPEQDPAHGRSLATRNAAASGLLLGKS